MALILFIDDDPLTLRLYNQVSEILGHEAITHTSGTEALEAAAIQCPDLILLDWNLAISNGLSVLEKLRENPHITNIPVIVLSAETSPNVEILASEAGAKAYLDKPIKMQTLIDVICEHTGHC